VTATKPVKKAAAPPITAERPSGPKSLDLVNKAAAAQTQPESSTATSASKSNVSFAQAAPKAPAETGAKPGPTTPTFDPAKPAFAPSKPAVNNGPGGPVTSTTPVQITAPVRLPMVAQLVKTANGETIDQYGFLIAPLRHDTLVELEIYPNVSKMNAPYLKIILTFFKGMTTQMDHPLATKIGLRFAIDNILTLRMGNCKDAGAPSMPKEVENETHTEKFSTNRVWFVEWTYKAGQAENFESVTKFEESVRVFNISRTVRYDFVKVVAWVLDTTGKQWRQGMGAAPPGGMSHFLRVFHDVWQQRQTALAAQSRGGQTSTDQVKQEGKK
jgi:hypothetical protein